MKLIDIKFIIVNKFFNRLNLIFRYILNSIVKILVKNRWRRKTLKKDGKWWERVLSGLIYVWINWSLSLFLNTCVVDNTFDNSYTITETDWRTKRRVQTSCAAKSRAAWKLFRKVDPNRLQIIAVFNSTPFLNYCILLGSLSPFLYNSWAVNDTFLGQIIVNGKRLKDLCFFTNWWASEWSSVKERLFRLNFQNESKTRSDCLPMKEKKKES